MNVTAKIGDGFWLKALDNGLLLLCGRVKGKVGLEVYLIKFNLFYTYYKHIIPPTQPIYRLMAFAAGDCRTT